MQKKRILCLPFNSKSHKPESEIIKELSLRIDFLMKLIEISKAKIIFCKNLIDDTSQSQINSKMDNTSYKCTSKEEQVNFFN